MQKDEQLSMREASIYLGIDIREIKRLCIAGEISQIKHPRSFVSRIKRSELDRFLERHREMSENGGVENSL